MAGHYDWSYDPDNGPSMWPLHFPNALGTKQSPIDINPTSAVCDKRLTNSPLVFRYERENHMKLVNSGHAGQANIEGNSILSGGPLNHSYKLAQFHFHIGAREGKGSEHTINGKRYSAEIHLVHWNAEKYSCFEDAVQESDGLAVLAVLVKVGKENERLKPMINNLKHVHHSGDVYRMKKAFNPRRLLPVKTANYWTYEGSLTTPPNNESVTWIVFEQAVEVSEKQLHAMRSLTREDEDDHIVNNYRFTYPLGDRIVHSSFKPELEIPEGKTFIEKTVTNELSPLTLSRILFNSIATNDSLGLRFVN